MKQFVLLSLLLASCAGEEAIEMQVPVVVDATQLDTVVTDLGYSVTVTSARAAIADIQFTVQGEDHEVTTVARVWDWLVPSAHAHPGHSGGGQVTGELNGSFIIDWVNSGQTLGTGNLLTGQYRGANFSFRQAGPEDGLSADDLLNGHTFALELEVSREQETFEVEVAVLLDEGTAIVGVPFDHEITSTSTEPLGLVLTTQAPDAGGTLFDGIDFAAAAVDSDGVTRIVPGQTEHNQLRRLLGSHDFYNLQAQ